MKKNYCLVVILVISFCSSISFASQDFGANPLSKKIKTVLTDFGENINIGIFVQDAKTGKVLFKKDGDRYFTPASNQKLFTAFAALQYLGPNFTYKTLLYADSKKIHKNVLKDNLYIQFSGDPTLTIPQFDQLISSLTAVGIRHIHGKVIINDTAFDEMTMSPGTAWDDQNFCWGSPLSALILNHNCVSAILKPAAQAGQPASLELPSYPQSMQFVNQVITGAATEKDCVIKVKRSTQSSYTISGCVRAGSGSHTVEMAISNPRENVQALLNYVLKKNEIDARGKIEFKNFELKTTPFAIQESAPLKTLVAKMLKDSDNTIADALFKTMGATHAHEAGSFANGNIAVRDIVEKAIQLNIPKTIFIDGAGQSRYNFLTPEQIVILLQKIFVSPGAAEFISSLAISGVDGTLKGRMKEPLTLGKIHAKTGSETGVISLSGYLETKQKQTLIFSIMINGFTGPSSKYLALEDKICRVLVEAD